MTGSPAYSFRPVTPTDADLLAAWLGQAHVGRWWDADDGFNLGKLGDPRVRCWIVSAIGRPFAYMQDYTVHGWADHHFFSLPEGSRGIDQYIGEPDMLGMGHGSAFIMQRLKTLFREGVPVVATDPHPDNARAIAAYQKAGFQVFGAPQDTPWGKILPMKAAAKRDP